MCWGAIRWSRLRKVFIGVDRFTAAKFGFDDKVFYDEARAAGGKGPRGNVHRSAL